MYEHQELILYIIYNKQMRTLGKTTQFANILCLCICEHSSIISMKYTVQLMVNGLACTIDAAPSSLAGFDNSRCKNGCVHSTEPLSFTCELINVFVLRIVLPNGGLESLSIGDTASDVGLPDGFRAKSLNIVVIDGSTRSFSLKLSITNASLLDGREIICDDTTPRNKVMAGCPVCGKF